MKTRPKQSKSQTPAAAVTDVKPPQPKTSAERFAQQRRIHLKLKKKTQGPGISPKLSVPKQTTKAPVSNPSPVAPAFSEQTLKRFDMAVKGLKAQGRSLNQRLLISAFHLQFDPALSGIDPRELLKELNSQN